MPAAIPELESPEAVLSHLAERAELRDVVIQGVDLRECVVDWGAVDLDGATFLACQFPDGEVAITVQRGGAVVIPDLSEGRPYRVYPSGLYTYESLTEGGADAAIEAWFRSQPEPMAPVEAIAQRLHDTAMTDATNDLIAPAGGERLRVVGIMGGHAVRRDSAEFEAVVRLAHGLSAGGYLIATGGGPGVMEAGNLGAYLTRAAEGPQAIGEALRTLVRAPTVEHADYEATAEEVHASYARADGGESLAIPTWLYGHEPLGRFATRIAKYFANSIREDGLLQIADDGIVFARGGAGTIQEVFQDAAINAYAPAAERAPMVFFGREFFTANGVWDVMRAQAAGAEPPYDELLTLTDDVDEAIDAIRSRRR